jgi:hypothetical protein
MLPHSECKTNQNILLKENITIATHKSKRFEKIIQSNRLSCAEQQYAVIGSMYFMDNNGSLCHRELQ